MANTYAATVGLNFSASEIGSPVFGQESGSFGSTDLFTAVSLATGTGANQFNIVSTDLQTLAASGTHSYDLTALTDLIGGAQNAARVRGIAIVNTSTTDGNNLLWDGTVANAWLAPFGGAAGKFTVAAGGFVVTFAPLATGLASISGTAKIIEIVNPNASSVGYKIALICANA